MTYAWPGNSGDADTCALSTGFRQRVFLPVFIILPLKAGSILLADGDTGYHIRTGEFIIRNWTIPTHDIFSYLTPASNWIGHEWLSEVLMAIIYRTTGLSGLVIWFCGLFTHAFLYRSLCSSSSNVLPVIMITAIAVATSSTDWLARPHVFSLALTLAWYHTLNDYQFNHRNTLKYLPALMLLWVNPCTLGLSWV